MLLKMNEERLGTGLSDGRGRELIEHTAGDLTYLFLLDGASARGGRTDHTYHLCATP